MTKTLDQIPISHLQGVGEVLSKKLARIGIATIQDLLFHLPFRFQDRTQLTPIRRLRFAEEALIEGEILHSEIVLRKKRSLYCQIADQTGTIGLRFFYFNLAQKNQLSVGARIRCYGEVRHGSSGYEIYHPEYQVIYPGKEIPLQESLTPIYPSTEGLTQNRLRHLVQQALEYLQKSDALPDWIPETVEKKFALSDLQTAIISLHCPPKKISYDIFKTGRHPAQQRLAFEELLAHHLSLLKLRKEAQDIQAIPLPLSQQLLAKFLQVLPFKLTQAQDKVFQVIAQELCQTVPMLRLLQGDVGSGKTVVAAMSALQCIENGQQAALLAPTEILAEQHWQNFSNWFKPLNLKVGYLTGHLTSKERELTLNQLASGELHLIVGTHALFQPDVHFNKLSLVIVDEQHRFGVHQRLLLREKGLKDSIAPHQLILTATPIPRTLAMSIYADLDCSILDELPPGRLPVKTVVMADNKRDEVMDHIKTVCAIGRQVYWVCTLIEESEELQCQAAEMTAAILTKTLPNISIGLIHGRMKTKEKTGLMEKFKRGDIMVLVATTVIEVGVDVPNASVMVIENAERLGLAQLHQLRGRVGRGVAESFCILLYQAPLSDDARERLKVMRETNDGFLIAEKDLELRGPGEVLGTRQTGLVHMRVADLMRDASLLPTIRRCAVEILQNYPANADPLIRRWLGEKEEYGRV